MIATRIQELRTQHRLSQSNLAKKLHVSTKTIKNWECGISFPSAPHLAQLASLFGVTADYLLGIDNGDIVVLHGLNELEKQCVRAMIQAYIQTLITQKD